MIQTYRFSDAGAPALLLHCALGRAQDWRSVLGALQTPLATEGFDMPGHGASAPWDGTDPHTACVAQAAKMIGAPSVVIGHSFGATVALRLALERPDLLRALILIEPVLFASARGTPSHTEFCARDADFAQFMAQGRFHDAAAGFLALWGTGTTFDRLPERDQDRLAAHMPFVASTGPALNDDATQLLSGQRLEGLQRPVLLLHGAQSPPIMRDIITALAARLPQAQQQMIDGAGHMLPITHPKQSALAMDQFLAAALA